MQVWVCRDFAADCLLGGRTFASHRDDTAALCDLDAGARPRWLEGALVGGTASPVVNP